MTFFNHILAIALVGKFFFDGDTSVFLDEVDSISSEDLEDAFVNSEEYDEQDFLDKL